jgi:hypothetical protein
MRLIIDTNQVDRIIATEPTNSFAPTLVVPLLVWSELLRSRDYGPRRAVALSCFDILFGVDIANLLDGFAWLPEKAISAIDPVVIPISETHDYLMRGFLSPTDDHFKRADELKRNADQFAEEVRQRSRAAAKKYNDMRSRGEKLNFVKWTTIEDAEALLLADENSHWAAATVAKVTQNDTRQIKAGSKASLHAAIMANPSVRLWTRVAITEAFGYDDCWRDQTLNTTPAGNDLTDVGITVNARPGDIILTAEKKLKRAIKHSDPESQFDVMTWDEYKTMRGV